MPDRLPEGGPARRPISIPKALAKTLLRATRAGTLGTLDRNTGHPFASLVNVATDVDGSPVILTSRLSTHTANLEARRPRLDPARRDRQGRSAGASAPDRARRLRAHREGERRRGARAAALPGAPSEVGALCRLRRLRVLAHDGRVRASQWRLRARRGSDGAGRADRPVGRGGNDRRRGGRGRAHERGPCRGDAALCDEAARRGRGPVAHQRHRSGRRRPDRRRPHRAAARSRSG